MSWKMIFKKMNEKAALFIAFVTFSLGMLVVWFGTNEALLKKLTNPRIVEFFSEGVGFISMLAATWLIFKKCK